MDRRAKIYLLVPVIPGQAGRVTQAPAVAFTRDLGAERTPVRAEVATQVQEAAFIRVLVEALIPGRGVARTPVPAEALIQGQAAALTRDLEGARMPDLAGAATWVQADKL
jgi:hypothetical protein